MFEQERKLVPKPWTGCDLWLDKWGEEAWGILCDISPLNVWFDVSSLIEAYIKRTGKSDLMARREMLYLLRLASIQEEPATKRLGNKWFWIGSEG